MKKLAGFIIAIGILLTASCSSFTTNYKANKLHEQGDYVESSITIIDYLKNNPDYTPPKKMINLINNNVSLIQKQINNLATTAYDPKIKHYKELRTITLAIDNANLSPKPLLTNPPLSLIDITLAELYYLKGNAITPNQTQDYLTKAQIYKEGLQFYNYKDMQQLMEQNQYTYSSNLAEEHYQQAVLNIQIKSYQRASEFLEKAIIAYQDYGDYKDSKALFAKYDPIWRKQRANELYNLASSLISNNNSTTQYKQIYDYYQQAYEVYGRYGDFKDSQQLAEKYQHEWRKSLADDYYQEAESYRRQHTKRAYRKAAEYYQLAYDTYSRYGSYQNSAALASQMLQESIINVGHSLYGYSGVNQTIIQAIDSTFSGNDFNISSYSADFSIEPDLSVKTEVIDEIISERDITKDGYSYKEIKRLNVRIYKIDGSVRISGKLYDSKSINIEETSSITHTYYEGSYPNNLRDSYSYDNAYGTYIKNESELENDALYELKYELTRYFDSIKQQALDRI